MAEGLIAVVTGASRGAGHGIAVELGAIGATVYVTGRTTRARAPQRYGAMLAAAQLERMPGDNESTAEAVTAAGGQGVAIPCDHTDPAQVRALFERVGGDHDRLCLLVNNAWGGHEAFAGDHWGKPFWEQDAARREGGPPAAALPLLRARPNALVVTTTFDDDGRFLAGNLYYDLAKATLSRFALGAASELAPLGITSLALSPGFMRTELVLAHSRATEAAWTDVPALAQSESPRYVGRAVAALVRDDDVSRFRGRTIHVADLAREYGFSDVDGRQPTRFKVPDAP